MRALRSQWERVHVVRRYIDVENVIKTGTKNQSANAGKLIPAGALLPAAATGEMSFTCGASLDVSSRPRFTTRAAL